MGVTRRELGYGFLLAMSAGCIGVGTETKGDAGGGSASVGSDGGDYSGGETTDGSSPNTSFPAIDQQRIEIRNQLQSARESQSVNTLSADSKSAAGLREIAQTHASAMAERGTVSMDVGGSIVQKIKQDHGECSVQEYGGAERWSGEELVFLGRVSSEVATDPKAAANQFLGHWLNDIETRPILVNSRAEYLGLGLAYGDGLYIALLIC